MVPPLPPLPEFPPLVNVEGAGIEGAGIKGAGTCTDGTAARTDGTAARTDGIATRTDDGMVTVPEARVTWPAVAAEPAAIEVVSKSKMWRERADLLDMCFFSKCGSVFPIRHDRKIAAFEFDHL